MSMYDQKILLTHLRVQAETPVSSSDTDFNPSQNCIVHSEGAAAVFDIVSTRGWDYAVMGRVEIGIGALV